MRGTDGRMGGWAGASAWPAWSAWSAWYRLAVALGFLAISPSARLPAQSFEERLLAVPDTASMRQMSRTLTLVPHMAGTPAQATTRDYALERMRAWGIEAWSKDVDPKVPRY